MFDPPTVFQVNVYKRGMRAAIACEESGVEVQKEHV